MPYFDELFKQTIPYDISVDNSTGGKIAITILKINKRDQFAAAEMLSVDPGVRTTLTDTVGRGIERVILAVHPLAGHTVGIEIRQGAMFFVQSCYGDTDIVFDTMP